jgi:hypothetical protein
VKPEFRRGGLATKVRRVSKPMLGRSNYCKRIRRGFEVWEGPSTQRCMSRHLGVGFSGKELSAIERFRRIQWTGSLIDLTTCDLVEH